MRQIIVLSGLVFAVYLWNYLNHGLPIGEITIRDDSSVFRLRSVSLRQALRSGGRLYVSASLYEKEENQLYGVDVISDTLLEFKTKNAGRMKVDDATSLLLLTSPPIPDEVMLASPGKVISFIEPEAIERRPKTFGFEEVHSLLRKKDFFSRHWQLPFRALGISLHNSTKRVGNRRSEMSRPFGESISYEAGDSLLTCFPFHFSDWDVVIRPIEVVVPTQHMVALFYGSGCRLSSRLIRLPPVSKGDLIIGREDIELHFGGLCQINRICLESVFNQAVTVPNPPLLFMQFPREADHVLGMTSSP